MKTGVLVVNLGTPEAPTPAAVRSYLAEFLSDPRVIDIHPIGRWMLLHLVVLRTRPARSAAAYAKVWTEEGSPLLVIGRRFVTALRRELPELPIALAMRYGQPSLDAGLDELVAAGCDRVVVFPLYPQYAASSTGSTLEAVYAGAGRRWNTPHLSVVPPFYDDTGFVAAAAGRGREVLARVQPERVLMSFHGLPERQIHKSDFSGQHCLHSAHCCDAIGEPNRMCYRAQCFATARALARALELAEGAWSVSFQSRLGRTPWIKPYTDVVLDELARDGVKRVVVFCPAFVADCLETLEEIGIAARERFAASGGQLELVPCVDDDPAWVSAAADLVRRAIGS